jgi:hypothetical protein
MCPLAPQCSDGAEDRPSLEKGGDGPAIRGRAAPYLVDVLVQWKVPLPAALDGGEQDHEKGNEANCEAAD